jgi:hypothetical protein
LAIGRAACPNDPECQAITGGVGFLIGLGAGIAAAAIVSRGEWQEVLRAR